MSHSEITVRASERGWQESNEFIADDLTTGTLYTYRVRARDIWGNETAESIPVSTTIEDWDDLPPTPNPPAWTIFPSRVQDGYGIWWHQMAVEEAADDNGVEYYFECLDDGSYSSGWRSLDGIDPFGNIIGPEEYWVQVGGQYIYFTYRVKVRDMSPNQNETLWSSEETAQ